MEKREKFQSKNSFNRRLGKLVRWKTNLVKKIRNQIVSVKSTLANL